MLLAATCSRRLLVRWSQQGMKYSTQPGRVVGWDNLFENLPTNPPESSTTTASPRARLRRQTMTAREIGVFDEMFNMIFDSLGEQNPDDPTKTGLGIRKGTVSDFFGKLRSQSLKSLWVPASNEELDQKKEAMNLCDTDHQLLEWAMQEVFGESEKFLQDAIQAMKENKTPLPMLQPPTYPYIVALLMRTFRVKYNDPHLALSIFDHARHLSAASYVFGCSTQAYNELIETRWTSFRDLRGVHSALEEMNVNGVLVDAQTRKLVNIVRQEVGARNIWAEEDKMGSGDMFAMLEQIEKYVGNTEVERNSAAPSGPRIDGWKFDKMEDKDDDRFGFDKWDTRGLARGGGIKKPWGSQKM